MRNVYIFLYFLVFIIVLGSIGGFNYSGNFLHSSNENANNTKALSPEAAYFNHRKLMLHRACTNRDISISQSIYPTSGIPQYIVQIVNTCITKSCAPSDIHLQCGWFASARIVNPSTFKRLNFDDCLVNGGRPLKNSQIIRFTYANSYMYPLQFKSASFCSQS